MPRDATLRLAREADAPRIVEIEIAAGRLFRDIGMALVADHAPDADELLEFVRAERAWVIDVGGVAVAYAVAEVLDGNAHLAQVSVDPAHAGHRHGSRLVTTIEQWGQRLHCPATTLTTFTDVPWNAPYYRRLGYEVLAPELVGPELRRTMAREAALPGIEAVARGAMIRHDAGTGGSQRHRG